MSSVLLLLVTLSMAGVMEVQDAGRDLVVESANFAFNSLFMEIPKGMEASVDECLILNKIMYGLVQSAREFYNKLVSALKDCGFQGSLVDPCLWIKHLHQGIVIIAIYVDDYLIIGDDSNINEIIQELKGSNFDGSLGKVPKIKVPLDLKPNSKPFCARAYKR
jgi:Reverse transcriptase (RNA-dependent DNA polymerase)